VKKTTLAALAIVFIFSFITTAHAAASPTVHYIPWIFATYGAPDLMAEKTGEYTPQRVSVITRKADGWALIMTDQGGRWVYLKDNLRYLNRSLKLFNNPEDPKSNHSITPQIVKVVAQEGDWLQIESWLGLKWVNPRIPALPEGVTVIGDSVCLGAVAALEETIPNCTVDALGSRQLWQGYTLMMELQEKGLLREYVVISLGTNINGNVFAYIDKMIEDIRPGYRLLFVTPYNGQLGESSVSYKTMEYMRTLPDIYPFVTVADWAGVIAPQKSVLGGDKIHIGGNRTSVGIYVNCIVDALKEAEGKTAKQ